MLGALSTASLTLGLGGAPAPFTAQCANTSTAAAAKPLVLLPATSSSSNIHAASQLLGKSSFTCASPSRTSPSLIRTAVAAVESDQLTPGPEQQQAKKYYFLVANAKFMLDEEEHFREQLFERLRLYEERDKEQDFWLVIEPLFLEKFPNITKRLRRPAVALVSTNGPWIT